MPWTRATSSTWNGRRATGSSRLPACGPVPVTSVPVAMTTMARPPSRAVSLGIGPDTVPVATRAWSPARWWSTTALNTSTIDSAKWPSTSHGFRWLSTTMPPRTTWPTTPATSPHDHRTRSARRGLRASEPSTAAITATDTSPVMSRLPNSIQPWNSASGTNRSCSQVGQSEQPRPDPVRRTAAPVTTIPASRTRATPQIRR